MSMQNEQVVGRYNPKPQDHVERHNCPKCGGRETVERDLDTGAFVCSCGYILKEWTIKDVKKKSR